MLSRLYSSHKCNKSNNAVLLQEELLRISCCRGHQKAEVQPWPMFNIPGKPDLLDVLGL